MKTRDVVGWMALALALNACKGKTEHAVDAAAAPATAKSAAPAPLVSARELARFIPDKIGEYVQVEEVETSIANIEDKRVTKAVCKYETGGKTLFITITDVIGAEAMRMPFAKAAGFSAESAGGGYQRGKRIGAHPAIVVWDANVRRSEVQMLVAGRFGVKVDVRKATIEDEAEKLTGMLDIDGLAKLQPSAE